MNSNANPTTIKISSEFLKFRNDLVRFFVMHQQEKVFELIPGTSFKIKYGLIQKISKVDLTKGISKSI